MEAKEFSNGLYLSMSNMGVTAGTSICGMLLVTDQTNLLDLVPGAMVFLVLAVMAIVIRQRMLGKADPTGTSTAEASREPGSLQG